MRVLNHLSLSCSKKSRGLHGSRVRSLTWPHLRPGSRRTLPAIPLKKPPWKLGHSWPVLEPPAADPPKGESSTRGRPMPPPTAAAWPGWTRPSGQRPARQQASATGAWRTTGQDTGSPARSPAATASAHTTPCAAGRTSRQTAALLLPLLLLSPSGPSWKKSSASW